MADNLQIRIIGTLNQTATIEQINASLLAIESKINRINLNVEVNGNANQALQALNTQVRNLGSNTTTNAAQNLNRQLNNIGNSAQQAGHHAMTFGNMLSQAFTKFPIWMIATTAFYAPVHAIQSLIQNLYLLDERMVSIKKVLDNANMDVVFQNATKAAYDYGRTIDGALQSLGEIAKLGFNQQDAQQLNNNALLLSTVGEFQNDAEAANYLVAIMRQYKFTVAETTDVVSALNEVSNKTGADTLGLAQAISKSSSSAAMAGVSFNDLNGMVASTIETLKIGGNEAGNFYKTLFTRYLRSNTQNALEQAGIQVKDVNGNLLSMTKVLEQLGQNWGKYSNTQQNAIAMALGGVYHINKVSSLIENQGNAYKYAQYSANSYGSAQKELATFQEGLQYKTNQMIASFQELAMSIGQNGARGALVDLITVVTDITKGFTELTDMTGGWNIKLPIIAAGIYGVVKAFQALRLAVLGVKASFGWISLAIIGIETVASAFMNMTKASEMNTQALSDTAKATATNTGNLQSLINKYNELEPQAKNNVDKQKELQDVLKQIQQIAPQLVDSTGKYGDALTLNKSKTDQYIKSLKEMTAEQVKQAQTANAIELSNVNVKIDDAQKKLNSMEGDVKKSFDTIQSYQKKYGVSGIIDAEKEYNNRRKQIAEDLDKALSTGNSKLSTKLSKQFNIAESEYNAYLTLIKDSGGELTKYSDQVGKVQELESKKKDIQDRKKALDDLTSSVNDNSSSSEKQAGALSKVAKGTYEASDGADGLSSSVGDLGTSMDGATDSTSTFDDELKNAKGDFNAIKDVILKMVNAKQIDQAITATENDAYSALADNISPVNKMLEDLAQGHALSASSAMELIQKIPEMTKYLQIENGQISVNTQGVLDWRDAQINSFNDIINAQKKSLEAQKTALSQKLKMYGIDLAGIKTVAEAQQKLYEALSQKAKNEGRVAVNPDQAYPGLMDNFQGILDAEKQLDQLSSMASTGLTQVGTSADKASSSMEKSTYVADKYKNSMNELSTALEKVKNLQQQYPNSSQAYRNALQQEIDLLKQQKDLTDSQAKNLQSQISSGIIQQTGMIKSSSSSSSNTANYASGGSTQAQIWNFLKGKGLSDSAIAGIMGNLQVESSFNTTALGPQTKYGRPQGLAQWLGSRLSALQSQPNWTSLGTQLNFLWSEWSKMMPSNFNNLNASQAATTFESLFERSGGSLNSKRIANANSILSQFAGSSGAYSGGSSDASQSAADAAQALDQAKSDLLGLQKDSMDLQSQIQDLYLQIVQSKVAEFDNIKKQYDAQIAQYDYLQNVQDKNSTAWMQTQMNRESAYNQQIKTEQDSIDYLKQEIAYNNQLTEAQKATLSDDVLQRQQDLISLEQKLYDTRLQMANEIVDTYKQALTDMKDAATKSIDNMINEINKQADAADYKKKLSDAQKSAQDIQDEINKLMLDDSTAAKKRIADLQKQLSDQNDSIAQMVADNNKQTQIDNLNAKKDSISTYYDNMLNDEDKFAQMRSQILSINNQSIINELTSLSSQVQQNVNLLGTSVVNTLIDAINRANGYLGMSTSNASSIGHIASLDSGGYTGTWGSGGKFLLAHEKELMLNKSDTSNLLKVVDITRNLFSNIFKSPNLNGLSPAMAGGNSYNVNIAKVEVTGDENGANKLLSSFVTGVKRLGGKI